MFERYTDRARRVVVLAQEETRCLNHVSIGTEHILLGLIHEGEGVAANTLESFGLSLETTREKVKEVFGEGNGTTPGHIPFAPYAKQVLELALREALELNHPYISTEHILLAITRQSDGGAVQILTELGVDLKALRSRTLEQLVGYTSPSQYDDSNRPKILVATLSAEPEGMRTEIREIIDGVANNLSEVSGNIENGTDLDSQAGALDLAASTLEMLARSMRTFKNDSPDIPPSDQIGDDR